MGKIVSVMGRPFRNFNVESRAHKIISKEKPTPAPKHKSDQMDIERLANEYPEAYKENLQKHEQLDKFLKDVYVKSYDKASGMEEQPKNPERPLPLDRGQVRDFEYGIKEPEKVSLGKATLKSALKIITDHQANSKLNSVEKLAKEYSIPEETLSNVLKYFKVYEVYIPEQRKSQAKFAGPTVPRIKIMKQPRKQLAAGDQEKDKS